MVDEKMGNDHKLALTLGVGFVGLVGAGVGVTQVAKPDATTPIPHVQQLEDGREPKPPVFAGEGPNQPLAGLPVPKDFGKDFGKNKPTEPRKR